jgi:ribosome biogenesis GTPase
MPRRSEFSRDSSQRGQHTLVANLDTLYVVFAASQPQPDLFLLDRFLVAAEAAELSPAIIVNKIDLVDDPAETRALFAPYERAGYEVRLLSARARIGVDELQAALSTRISAFAGPSGVGKSRLLNALCPGINRRVGDVGLVTYKGRHTTTSAELIPLQAGGWLADTPGLRQLEFWDVDKDDMPLYFPEFQPLQGECRFRNCRHLEETGCAVHAAAESGAIDPRRYQSYRQLAA